MLKDSALGTPVGIVCRGADSEETQDVPVILISRDIIIIRLRWPDTGSWDGSSPAHAVCHPVCLEGKFCSALRPSS